MRRFLPFLVAACAGEAPVPGSVLLGTGAGNPTVAVAPDGSAYAVWVADRDVWLASLSGEPSPVRINDVAGEGAPHLQAPPQVVADADGAIHVVWQRTIEIPGRRFPASDLRYARSTDGGRSFTPAIDVNDDAGTSPAGHTFHNVLVRRDGQVMVSWLDSRREPSDIRVARLDGDRFTVGAVVDTNVCPCCRTAMVEDRAGRLYVAWRKVYAGDERDVVVARSDDGGAMWSAPVRVHPDRWVYPGCPHAGPSLAIDDDGALVVVWYTGAEGRAGLWTTRSADGAVTFDDPEPVGVTGATPVALAALASGPWLAWEDRGSEHLRISRLDGAGTSWSVPGGFAPAIAASGDRIAAGWLEGDSARAAVLHARD